METLIKAMTKFSDMQPGDESFEEINSFLRTMWDGGCRDEQLDAFCKRHLKGDEERHALLIYSCMSILRSNPDLLIHLYTRVIVWLRLYTCFIYQRERPHGRDIYMHYIKMPLECIAELEAKYSELMKPTSLHTKRSLKCFAAYPFKGVA